MGIAGNKGGVGIRFRFYETDICFVNSHFASGDGQTQKRNDDYNTIESRMAFTDAPTYSFKDYIWYSPATAGSNPPNPQNSASPSQWLVYHISRYHSKAFGGSGWTRNVVFRFLLR
jgi:hypothetical protein